MQWINHLVPLLCPDSLTPCPPGAKSSFALVAIRVIRSAGNKNQFIVHLALLLHGKCGQELSIYWSVLQCKKSWASLKRKRGCQQPGSLGGLCSSATPLFPRSILCGERLGGVGMKCIRPMYLNFGKGAGIAVVLAGLLRGGNTFGLKCPWHSWAQLEWTYGLHKSELSSHWKITLCIVFVYRQVLQVFLWTLNRYGNFLVYKFWGQWTDLKVHINGINKKVLEIVKRETHKLSISI